MQNKWFEFKIPLNHCIMPSNERSSSLPLPNDNSLCIKQCVSTRLCKGRSAGRQTDQRPFPDIGHWRLSSSSFMQVQFIQSCRSWGANEFLFRLLTPRFQSGMEVSNWSRRVRIENVKCTSMAEMCYSKVGAVFGFFQPDRISAWKTVALITSLSAVVGKLPCFLGSSSGSVDCVCQLRSFICPHNSAQSSNYGSN